MILRVMGAIALAAGLAGPAGGAPVAYMPNEGSATISVIDTATDKVVDTLRFGKRPRGIATTSSTRTAG